MYRIDRALKARILGMKPKVRPPALVLLDTSAWTYVGDFWANMISTKSPCAGSYVPNSVLFCSQNLKKLRASKGYYCIKQWFSTITHLFEWKLLLKERISQRDKKIIIKQTVKTLMRRLMRSRLIFISTVCKYPMPDTWFYPTKGTFLSMFIFHYFNQCAALNQRWSLATLMLLRQGLMVTDFPEIFFILLLMRAARAQASLHYSRTLRRTLDEGSYHF